MGGLRQGKEKQRIPDGMVRKGLFAQRAGSARGTLCRAAVCGAGRRGAATARGVSVYSRRREGEPAVFSIALQIAFPSPEGREALCGCQG